MKKHPILAIIALLGLSLSTVACSSAKTNAKPQKRRTVKVTKTAKQVQTISYQTEYQGKSYTKKAQVYLPQNYDKNKKHNIVYLVHGSTEVKNGQSTLMSDGSFVKLLNNLNEKGMLKNTIVVFPTYYPSSKFVKSDYYSDRPLNHNFAKNEFIKDLVPTVEGKYKTYAKGTSKAALKASRNHRAFGGFSMGSITTWYAFQYDLDYVADFLPMAGDAWNITSDGGASEPVRTAEILEDAVSKANNPKFKILAGVGSADGTGASMDPQIRAMHNLNTFNSKNLQYYKQPAGGHDPVTIARIFRHYAGKLFK